jgi:hypothetical protein
MIGSLDCLQKVVQVSMFMISYEEGRCLWGNIAISSPLDHICDQK